MITDNKEKTMDTQHRKIIGVAIVDCDLLNIRKAPAVTSEILRTAERGEKFNVISGGANEFTALATDDTTAYAMTKFLRIIKN